MRTIPTVGPTLIENAGKFYQALRPNFPTILMRCFRRDALPEEFQSGAGFTEQSGSSARIFTKYCEEKMFGCDLTMLQRIGFIGGIGHDPFAFVRERHNQRRWSILHVGWFFGNPGADFLGGQGRNELLK